MGLHIKNVDVERLAREVAALAHETVTNAVRRALLERRARLQARSGKSGGCRRLREYLDRSS